MGERGKAKYLYISTGSNTTVKEGAGTVYRIINSMPGSVTRVEDGDLGQNPNMNGAGDTDTIAFAGGTIDFGPGVGFNTQLTVAASSNGRLTVVYE